jgi:hypothetical protein
MKPYFRFETPICDRSKEACLRRIERRILHLSLTFVSGAAAPDRRSRPQLRPASKSSFNLVPERISTACYYLASEKNIGIADDFTLDPRHHEVIAAGILKSLVKCVLAQLRP